MMFNTPDDLDRHMWMGASWYPEMWPEEEWPIDIARMNELGFNVVRLFEFAWHRFEPREGIYDFDWAVRLLDHLADAGISVVLGTPSAAPPAWLTTKYPEVLKVGADGRRESHGQRKHGSHVSPVYRKLCATIVEMMAKRLGGHRAVIAWQIDNEMSGQDMSPEAKQAFGEWLRRRYQTVERLNERWGLEFWSQAYDSFEQIPMARAEVGSIEVPERHHPSLIMALARFQNDQWSDYIREQCEVIRRHSPAQHPITTNMVHSYGMNWYQHNVALDLVGQSLYRDAEHYAWNVLPFDRMRAEKPGHRYWLLETAPNWSGGGRIWNIHQGPDGLEAMTWLTVALGGSMVLFWQWRQHWAGQEMQHGVHVSATGKWLPNRETWTKLANDFKRLEGWLADRPPMPAPVALMMCTEAAWAWSIDPIDSDMKYGERFRDDYHLPLVEHHLWRDIISPQADLSPYRVLLMPMMPIVSADLRQRLAAWVKAGGRLLLGPFTGYRSEEFTAFTDREFGGLEELIGAEVAFPFSPMWTESRSSLEFEDGRRCGIQTYAHAWKPTTGKVVAWYRQPATTDGRAAGYGHDQPAIIDHRYGEGRVVTVGTRIPVANYFELVRELCDELDIHPLAHGDGKVVVVPRAKRGQTKASAYFIVNLNLAPATIELPHDLRGVDRLTREASPPPIGGRLKLRPLQAMLLDCE